MGRCSLVQVQNVLDDVASILERCRGLVCWTDPNASAFFLLIATTWALGVAVLGLHTILSVLLCWMVRRFACIPALVACCVAGLPCIVWRIVCVLATVDHPGQLALLSALPGARVFGVPWRQPHSCIISRMHMRHQQ